MHWLTVLLFSSLIGIKLYFIILCFLNYRWDCHSFHICFWWYFLGAAVRFCPWLIFPLEPRWSSQVCIRRETSWPSDSQILLPDILIGRLLSSFLRTSRFPTEMWIPGFSWKAQDMEIHGPSSCVWTGKGSRAAWPPYKGHDARSLKPAPSPGPSRPASDPPCLPHNESASTLCFMMTTLQPSLCYLLSFGLCCLQTSVTHYINSLKFLLLRNHYTQKK